MSEESKDLMPDETLNKKYSFFANVHPITIVFGIIVLVAIATYLIPGGQFQRETVTVMGTERDLIIPGSFQFMESIPQSFSQIWTSFMIGARESVDIGWTILLCSGAFTAIIATGAVTNGINSVARRFSGHSIILIPVLVFTFGLGGATYGMYEDAIPFILVLCPLMLALGYDSLVGLMTLHFSLSVATSGAFLNPFCVGIGQALAEVPMMSGIAVRVVIWFVLLTATSIYIIRYAKKVEKNPKLSICYEEDKKNRLRYGDFSKSELSSVSKRDACVLVLLAAGFAIMIYGVMKLEWWFDEIGSIFLFMGIIIPIVGGMNVNQMIEANMEGMKSVVSVIVLLSGTRIIMQMLADSNTMDTILYAFSNGFAELPKGITVIIMYFVTAVTQIFVQSSSGVAATLMPIMAPLGDLLEIPRQTIVSAYALGTGTFGWLMPWEGINFAMCTLAGIPFFRYLKQTLHFVVTVYIPICIISLLLMVAFNYQ